MTIDALHGHEAQQKILADDRKAREQVEQQFNDENPDVNDKPKLYPLTDLGNSMRFIDDHGDNIRFCFQTGKWLIWNGKRWQQDNSGEIFRKVKLTVINMFREAYGDDRGSSHAAKSQSSRSMDAIVKVSRDQRSILPENLDCDLMLLNCANGTIDLRTGILRTHQRGDFITKLCPTIYTPDAKSDVFTEFLSYIFDGDLSLIEWLQLWFGYCLTGLTTEHLLPVFWGTGANGKSTLLEAILHVMGRDYSMQAPPNFLIQKRGDSHPTEMADLFGRRLVATSETGDGNKLAEQLVKSLTGGDTIRARRMREDFWQFEPSHKLILVTNHKPKISGTDHGMWRRLRLVPFNVTVPDNKQDKQLPAKLRKAAPAILAWMVKGCLKWQQHGLIEPEAIVAATKNYRDDEDVTGRFIAGCCITGKAYSVNATALFQAYQKWAESEGETAVSQRRFGEALTEKRFERYTSNGTFYRGLGFLTEPTEPYGT